MKAMRAASGLALALTAVALSGCYTSQREQENLALACTVRECSCTPREFSLQRDNLRPQPVQFTESGEAYCPQGFALRFVERPRRSFKRFYGG